MNERIKELAIQAGITTNLDTEYFEKDMNKWVDYFSEKFAELIVKECMTMCDETQSDYFKHRKASNDFTDKNIYAEGEAASDIIKYKMKKHFGVE